MHPKKRNSTKQDLKLKMEKLLERTQSRTLALKKILESLEAQAEEAMRKKTEEKSKDTN
jgi:hypothetical protein